MQAFQILSSVFFFGGDFLLLLLLLGGCDDNFQTHSLLDTRNIDIYKKNGTVSWRLQIQIVVDSAEACMCWGRKW